MAGEEDHDHNHNHNQAQQQREEAEEEEEEEEAVELILFRVNECYVYLIPPRKTAASYRADEWDVNKWNWEGTLKVVSKGEECIIRLEDKTTGELYARAFLRNGEPHPVEPVVDSSGFVILSAFQEKKSKSYSFISWVTEGMVWSKLSSLASSDTSFYELKKILYVKQVYMYTDDLVLKKQFSYIARHGLVVELDHEMVVDDDEREALQEIINNTKLSEGYLTLARDIEVMEPKSPEHIYKACHCCIWSSICPSVRVRSPRVSVLTAYGVEVEGFVSQRLKLIVIALMVLKVEAKVLIVLRVQLLEL